jgi:kinetochore protein Mis12/MTW1
LYVAVVLRLLPFHLQPRQTNTRRNAPNTLLISRPQSLIDDIINAINEVLYRCTDSFETGLLAADPALLGFADRYSAEGRTPEKDEDGNDAFPEARLEVEEGVLKLETLMENAVDKNFDRLEIWTLRNVLCLPRGEEELVNWVRLGGYEVSNLFTEQDDGCTEDVLEK